MITSVTTTRYDDLRRIEAEVGTLIRRVKRVMGERAREVHPDLHPMTYFILTHLVQHGPQQLIGQRPTVGDVHRGSTTPRGGEPCHGHWHRRSCRLHGTHGDDSHAAGERGDR